MQLDAAATGDRSRSGARDVQARSGCGSSGAIGLGMAPWCFRGRCDRGPVAVRKSARRAMVLRHYLLALGRRPEVPVFTVFTESIARRIRERESKSRIVALQ